MLTFEVAQPMNDKGIQIYCNEAGLDQLISALQKVRDVGHIHLRAPSQAGMILRIRRYTAIAPSAKLL
jgi:hypothetical protein